MLLDLIKKDMLLTKKYLFTIMVLIVVIPLFFSYAAPNGFGMICFLYMVVLGGVMMLQAISQMEGKYPKATALLCASPYRRRTIVIAKYIFPLIIFAYCYVVYTLLTFLIKPANLLDPAAILTVLLIETVMYSLYMPFEFKYGFIKARFLFMIVILLFSMGPMLFSSLSVVINFKALAAAVPANIIIPLMAVSIVVITNVSLLISLKIFSEKEL